ncbi:MAG: PD-(D/E)XK nuclease family protein [Candidatus Nanopelagicales bacterium]|jgi:putative RecB family exonuclease|nr:PD-(D/E)XK nuclease family protein [Candidatus Nanopelagicales bacterium]
MPDTTTLPARPTLSLSPSRAQDFQSCPLLYRFRVLDRLPEPPSPAAVRGTLVHAVLEALYDLPAGQRTLESAIGLLAPQWAALVEQRPELLTMLEGLAGSGEGAVPGDEAAWLRGAGDLLETYFGLEDPARLEPAARELRVEAALPSGLVLRGFVDRLDVAPTGQVRVVDYKTGRPPGVGFEARAMFQMRFYALVLWRMRGEVPTVLQLMYLATGVVLRYEPDEADLLAMQRKIEALWAAISRAMESGDWRASPSALCQWCAHQALCPAWGGTPPPLPEASPESPAASAEAPELLVEDG